MRAVIMEKGNPKAWLLMPVLRMRVMEFDKKYTLDGSVSNIAELFEQCFAAGDKRMLALLLFPDDTIGNPPVGHLIAGIDTYHGTPQAVIYQYEKDVEDASFAETNAMVQSIVDTWVLGLGLRDVLALAMSASRAKHFEHWGYRYSATLVTRRIGHGEE